MAQRYSITDLTGLVLYTNLVRSSRIQGYDWNDGHGHITDALIKIERWVAVPVAAAKDRERRCTHGIAMENPCSECDEEKAERDAASPVCTAPDQSACLVKDCQFPACKLDR